MQDYIIAAILFCDTQARSRCRHASLDTPNPVHIDKYIYIWIERESIYNYSWNHIYIHSNPN